MSARVLWYLGGCAVSAVCFVVTVRAELGLGPLFVVQDGVHQVLGISLGQSVMLVGTALVVAALLLRGGLGLGTFALPLVMGAMIDLLLPHLGTIDELGTRVLACTVASWCITLGGAMVIKARLGIAALDGVMMGLHRITGWPIGPLRLGMEATMLGTGWLLGGAVGLGTVIMGALIGHGLQFWMRVLRVPSLTVQRAPVPVGGRS
jgi:uncharacterized membrane protein YczE